MSAPRTVLVAMLVVASAATAGLAVSSVGSPEAVATSQSQQSTGPTELGQCTVIDEPGRYELTANVSPSESEETCIEIVASDVVLDGNGHTVGRDDGHSTTPLRVGSPDGVENVTVTNVDVQNNRAHAPTVLFANVTDAELSDVSVDDGRSSVLVRDASDILVADFEIDGYHTIGPFDTIHGVHVVDSRNVTVRDGLTSSVHNGVTLDGGGDHTVADLSLGTAASAGEGAVVLATDDSVVRNVSFEGGLSPQFRLAESASGNRIVENHITGEVVINTTGSADEPNRIARNTFTTTESIGAIGIEVRRNSVPLDVRANVFEGLDRPLFVDPPTNDTTAASTVDVHHNVFRDGNFGVRNEDPDDVVDARDNYWGAANGPTSKTVRGPPAFEDPDAPFEDPVTGKLADGNGSGVSESGEPGVSNVHFDPYLTSAPAAGVDAPPGAGTGEPNGTAPGENPIQPPEPEPPAEPEVNGTAVTECRVIDEPGRYVLTEDLSDDYDPCIQIAASDVVLDGNGHTVDAGTAGTGFLVGAVTNASERPFPTDGTVENVTVEDVTLKKSTVSLGRNAVILNASDVRFQDVTIDEGSTGLYVRDSTDVTVADFEALGFQTGTIAAARVAVHAEDSQNVTVRDGRTDEFYRGVVLEGGGGHTVADVTVAPTPLPADRKKVGVTLSTADSVVRNVEVASNADAFAVVERNASGNELVDNRVNGTVVVQTNGPAEDPNRVANTTFVGDGPGVHVRMNTVPLRIEANAFRTDADAVVVEPPASCAFGGEGAETVQIHRNDFEAGQIGVNNTDANEIVDARNNYWGTANGPASVDDADAPLEDPVTGALADGDGAAVTEGSDAGVSNVRFDPFLAAAPADAGDDSGDDADDE